MPTAALDWLTVDRLFGEALDLPEPERAAFVGALADDALRDRLEHLLSVHCDATFLDRTPGAHASALVARALADDGDRTGERVGPYRLVREIGRGGMGVVYLAERADGAFEQTVALKLLKRGTDTDAVVERFVRERAVLARLEHPGIARLLGGGATGAGAPYFAMEVVRGEPLDAYCDRRRLPVEARLGLFAQVCRAVQYAHQSLVVHRDLKPSNMLVAEGPDGAPVVKLLDFGIARLLASDDGDDAEALTRGGVPVLTPEYAAPEQLLGGTVTTATDVYALGVVLYGLLAGAPPYRFAARTQAEAERVVLGITPPPPSTAVTPDAADARAATTARLARRLAGDLDAVCLVALRKRPAERYATPGRLLDDIEAYLAGTPVSARRSGWTEHARLFVRRNRRAATAGAAFVALLVAYAATVTVQARQIAHERDLTRAEARNAAAVADFLSGLFEASDPYGETVRGDTLTARTLLARGAARARSELAGEPLVRARMLDRIGQVYAGLGLYAEADTLLTEALGERRRYLGPAHADVAETTGNLASARWHRGDNAAAERLFRAALAASAGRPADALTAELLNNLGTVVQGQGRNRDAEALHRRALALRRALPDSTAGDGVAISLNDLAWALQAQGRPAEAEPLFRDALARFEHRYGPEHAYVVQTMGNLARVQLDRGHAAEAERTARVTAALARRVFPAGHPLIARYDNHRGAALAALGRTAEAERVLLQSHAALVAARGPDHFHVAESRARLAALYDATGRSALADRFR